MKAFLATVYTPTGRQVLPVIAKSSVDAFLRILDAFPEGTRVHVRAA